MLATGIAFAMLGTVSSVQAASFTFVKSIGSFGAGNGQFSSPHPKSQKSGNRCGAENLDETGIS